MIWIWIDDNGTAPLPQGITATMTVTGTATSSWTTSNFVVRSPYRSDARSFGPMLDALQFALTKAQAPAAILEPWIRGLMRCARRATSRMPVAIDHAPVLRKPRRRQVHHGVALLNFYKVAA